MKHTPAKRTATPATCNPGLASLILRIGLAAVFIYAAIGAFVQPDAWISFVPSFTSHFIAPHLTLDIISVVQLGLAACLLLNLYATYTAIVAILFLAGVMVFNLATLLITFRDIGLIAAAVAVILLDRP